MHYFIIYLTGVLVASVLLAVQNRRWLKEHPEEDIDWIIETIAAASSWLCVAALIFGGLAGFNRLDDEQ